MYSNRILPIYGVTQLPETKKYMIVMKYANIGSLSSYLDQNINSLTWKMKVQYLFMIASDLENIHDQQLIHCDLHGGNIVLNDQGYIRLYICDFGLSRSVKSS